MAGGGVKNVTWQGRVPKNVTWHERVPKNVTWQGMVPKNVTCPKTLPRKYFGRVEALKIRGGNVTQNLTI